jgi:hypothetical protein
MTAERERPNQPGCLSLLFWWAALALVLAVGFRDWIPARGVLLVAVGVPLLLVLLAIVMVAGRMLLLRSEKYDLGLARKSAGEEGEIHREGEVTIWLAKPSSNLSLITRELEVSRKRFEALMGEPVPLERPLRVICFSTRTQFTDYLRRVGLTLGGLDGLYQPGRSPRLILSDEEEPTRPVNSAELLRILFTYHLKVTYKGFLPILWLNQGLAYRLADEGDTAEQARVHRWVHRDLVAGEALGADELFRLKSPQIVRRLRKSEDLENFSFFRSFSHQAHSVVQYLCGEGAPTFRREQFVAFFKDLRPRDSCEAVFQRHLGQSFEQMLADWAEWVRAQGVGRHEPPSPRQRDALVRCIIPLVRDRGAKPSERVQAIRDMATAGFTLGADVLIEQLRHESKESLRAELVWALEHIAGLPLGDSVSRWEEWWGGLGDQALSVPAAELRTPSMSDDPRSAR